MRRREAVRTIARMIAAGTGMALGLPLMEGKANAEKENKAVMYKINGSPKSYKLAHLQKVVDETKNKLIGMKVASGGYQSFKMKKVGMSDGSWLSAEVTMKPIKEYPPGIKLVTTKKGKGKWITGISFTTLMKRYKEKTGEKLKYVTMGLERFDNGDLNIYIIPAKTFEDALGGEIEAGVPVLVIPYIAEKKNFFSGYGKNVHNIVE